MIFIVVKFDVKPEYTETWLERTRAFTEATRQEPGNLWFEWSRSLENPDEFVLVEAFKDDAAEAHVTSDHFRKAQQDLPPLLQATPLVRNTSMERDEWDLLGEMAVD